MKRLGLSMLLAVVGLALGLTASMLLWPSGGARAAARGCWGSICQDRGSGTVFFNAPLAADQLISIATTPGAIEFPGDLTIPCTRGPVIGPGGSALTFRARPSLKFPGSMRLTAIAGSAQTETTLLDPVPGGTC